MKNMYNLKIFLFFLAISSISQAQVLTNYSVSNSISDSNVILDGSTSFSTESGAGADKGKGIVMPSVDLVNFEFDLTLADGVTFPTYFDGMIVYNKSTGTTLTTGNRSSTATLVTPGFYYFYNPSGSANGNVTAGVWKAMGGSSGGSGSVPAGTIVAYAGTTAPEGWFLCDGSEVSRTTYAELFAAVQIAYGTGDGINTFNLPNANGVFLRGAGTQDIGGRTYTAEAQGTPQGYATGYPTTSGFTATASGAGQHSHHHSTPSFTTVGVGGGGMGVSVWNGGYWPTVSQGVYGGDTPPHTHGVTGGDAETRPANIVVTYIIKY